MFAFSLSKTLILELLKIHSLHFFSKNIVYFLLLDISDNSIISLSIVLSLIFLKIMHPFFELSEYIYVLLILKSLNQQEKSHSSLFDFITVKLSNFIYNLF